MAGARLEAEYSVATNASHSYSSVVCTTEEMLCSGNLVTWEATDDSSPDLGLRPEGGVLEAAVGNPFCRV